MVLELIRGAKVIIENCMQLDPKDFLLVLSDTHTSSLSIGQAVAELARSMGVETVTMIMTPREIAGQEPPKPVAAAMKAVNKIFAVWKTVGIAHTDARKEVTALGIEYFTMFSEIGDDYLAKVNITPHDLMLIKERTERIARLLTDCETARVTSKLGTDLTFSLKGRQGLAIHPIGRGSLSIVPDYAEATIAPVEGTAEGTIVFDVEMIGWGRLLREPLRLKVKSGKVTEVEGEDEGQGRLSAIITSDANANSVAEFAIGTSHTIPRIMLGTRWDAGVVGMVHIALGRNNDIGGKNFSRIHIDGVISHASVELDDNRILDDGKLEI